MHPNDEEEEESAGYHSVQEYMGVLLEAGFSVQSVLDHGLALLSSPGHEFEAAQVIRSAARNLGIDADTQRRELERSGSLRRPALDCII